MAAACVSSAAIFSSSFFCTSGQLALIDDVVLALIRPRSTESRPLRLINAAALGRPLRLRPGRVLPPLRRVDLSPGPAFVWRQVALGGALAVAGVAALAVIRRLRLDGSGRLWVVRALSLGAFLAGSAVVIRSFRSM